MNDRASVHGLPAKDISQLMEDSLMVTVRLVLKRLVVSTAIIAAAFALLPHSAATANGSRLASRTSVDTTALFSSKCSGCHGKDGRGLPSLRAKGQPVFSDAKWQSARTDAQIAQGISDGKGKFMPAWKGKLSPEEIGGLVTHIRAFKR